MQPMWLREVWTSKMLGAPWQPCCDMCSQAELANVGPHSKVQFVVNYDAPANMEERCGHIGWHLDLFGLTSDIFHVNVLYTVILHFGVLGTICHRFFFFEPNNSHFSRTMCTESAVRAAQVKKAWSLPSLPMPCSRGSRGGVVQVMPTPVCMSQRTRLLESATRVANRCQ